MLRIALQNIIIFEVKGNFYKKRDTTYRDKKNLNKTSEGKHFKQVRQVLK
jgi:hypothetical protein